MKKLLLLFIISIFYFKAQAQVCVYHIDKRARNFVEWEWTGWCVEKWDEGGVHHIACWLSKLQTTNCPACPGVAGNGGGENDFDDPVDETAADYLTGLSANTFFDESFNVTFNAIYQVSGEENPRHYRLTRYWSGLEEDDIIQTFERLD